MKRKGKLIVLCMYMSFIYHKYVYMYLYTNTANNMDCMPQREHIGRPKRERAGGKKGGRGARAAAGAGAEVR